MDLVQISFPILGDNFIINPPRYIVVFGFNIYLYGMIIALGFMLAGVYMHKRHKLFGLTQDNVLDMVMLAVPSGIIGARLYYIIFNSADYFGAGKWHNIFLLRQGGLAVYGGVIGGAIAYSVYSRIKKTPLGDMLDCASFGLFIGQAIGRWGNFFNREGFGEVTELPWRMGLKASADFVYVHPTFLYESFWNSIGLLIMHMISKRTERKYRGQYFLMYVAWYGLGRFFIEGLRTDSLYIGNTGIRVSQLLAALSFVSAISLLVRNRLRGIRSLDISTIREQEEVTNQ